jgi:hypothetical protein
MSELLTDLETEPRRPDWLADDAVVGEPVWGAIESLLTGKITGNLAFQAGFCEAQRRNSPLIQ